MESGREGRWEDGYVFSAPSVSDGKKLILNSIRKVRIRLGGFSKGPGRKGSGGQNYSSGCFSQKNSKMEREMVKR